jgi:hypothetical protein
MQTLSSLRTIHPAKPDIYHPSLFKEGVRVVNQTPQTYHTGEKWESDKKHNKTQQLSHEKRATIRQPFLNQIWSNKYSVRLIELRTQQLHLLHISMQH